MTDNIQRKRKSFFLLTKRRQRFYKKIINDKKKEFDNEIKYLNLKIKTIEFTDLKDEEEAELNFGSNCNKKTNIYKFLYWKEVRNISDLSCSYLNYLNGSFPTLTSLINLRQEIDKNFTVNYNEYGCYVNLEEKIRYIILNLHKRKLIANSEDILIKISGDGTNLGKARKIFNLNFSVINEKNCTAASQQYTIGVFQLNEDYESLKDCLQEVLPSFSSLNSIECENLIFNVKFFLSGDLKFLSLMMGIVTATGSYPCPWCKCHKDQLFNSEEKWSITNTTQGARTLKESAKILSNGKEEFGKYLNL